MWYSTPMYNFLLNDTVQHKYLPILSDPTEEDSDGDELLDGQEQYLATQDFTMPKDPEPLKFTYFPKFGTEEYIQNTEQKYEGVEHQIKHMMSTVDRCKYTDLVDDENWLKFCEYFNGRVLEYGKVTQKIHYFRLKLNRTPESFVKLCSNSSNWFIYTKKHTAYHMNNGYFESSNENDYPSYSTYGNEYNMKFVDKYGMNEVVVTPNKDLSGMSNEDIYNYLTDATHWQILTDDYQKAKSNSNFKYDPVNVGTYNYAAYDFNYINLDGSIKETSSDLHNLFDVYPYLKKLKKGKNWGNIYCLIYGNTRQQRDDNYDYYKENADYDIYDMWWGGRFR